MVVGRGGRRSFTLVELLVVVSLVSLLLALLMPAIERARAVARDTVCGSNLRMIGLAEQNFASAHRSRLTHAASGRPRPDGRTCLVDVHPWEKTRGILWYETLFWGDYVDGLDVFLDPADPHPRRDPGAPETALVSYAINAYLDRGGVNNQLDRVVAPGRTLMITANNPEKATHSGLWNYARPDAHRHTNHRALYAFCDGHVKAIPFKTMFEIEYDPTMSYPDHWSSVRPELTTIWQNGWATDRSGEMFAHWAPWKRDGQLNP
jgi:prepilin-type N-terminal cleavage/methylation domain-containing protein/prepilin-type processing-associated H-X9-DG protein